ncbi:uncharacterized protein cubi_01101 [Cryptosporidium ubiquitum]|uniref:Protein kinase domain-containing protein n=1 Tax=Cryptosporidium ubiquitum TaxID=857276 RepID=A0A1J4MJ48_9CRYT|nr:uncharacterized protein cubi_01101 [Cryptosporidium ubiquitum]OII74257.1 hypothetical protein cubi_01101 [Cryptosporidium ubiquitum]
MHSIPTILRSSKSWSNSTQRSEYNQKTNNWSDFNSNNEKPNEFCSNSTFNGKFLNRDLSRSCYKSTNLILPENYQIQNGRLFRNSSLINENNVFKQRIINGKQIETNQKASLLQNPFLLKGGKHLVSRANDLINGFGAFEMEFRPSFPNNFQEKNNKLTLCLNSSKKKIYDSLNTDYSQPVPIACNKLFRATSFLERKPSLNYSNNNSVFLQRNSNFISENCRKNSIRSCNHVKYIQEEKYNSNNLSNNQLNISSTNQENSSIFLNNKPINSKVPNFISSKFYIRNIPKISINNASSKSIKPLYNFESNNWIELNLTNIKIFSLLGIGSTSSVYSAFWRGTEVAVKILGSCPKVIKSSNSDYLNLSINKVIQSMEMNKKDSQRYSEFKNEIKIMNLLRHPNIVQYMGGNISSNPPFLICEFCSGGTLFSLLHGDSKKCSDSNKFTFSGPSINLSLYQRIKILQDIARGIHFLHSANPPIIHRDIKSLNIFLLLPIKSNLDVPIAKVGDFGLCKQLFSNKGFADGPGNLVGTYQWMAPEVLTNQTYNEYIDVYSFGMIMYEVLSNKTPFFELGVDVNPEILTEEIIKGIRPTLKYIVSDAPTEIKNIMIRCWDPQPSKRGTMLIIINELQRLMEKLANS